MRPDLLNHEHLVKNMNSIPPECEFIIKVSFSFLFIFILFRISLNSLLTVIIKEKNLPMFFNLPMKLNKKFLI